MVDTPDIDQRTEDEIAADNDPNNVANRTAIKRKEVKAKHEEKERVNVLKMVLSSKHGRDWLGGILFDVCGLMVTTENAAHDTNSVHYRNGAREVALIIQKEALIADKDQYMVLLSEFLTRNSNG